MKKQFDFASAMKELEEINTWFQDQDIDLDQGLEKLRKAKELIAQCRDRLKNVENEFVKIKDEFEEPVSSTPEAPRKNTKSAFEDDLLTDADDDTDDDDLPF